MMRSAYPMVLAAVLLGAIARMAAAADWLAGDALAVRLAQPTSVFWEDAALRESLERFSRAQRVAVFLDRRVDPGQKIDIRAQAVPVADVFQRVATHCHTGLASFGPVTYFGRKDFTAKLGTLAALRHDDAKRLPPVVADRLLRSRPWAWDDLAMPRELLKKLAEEGRVELVGLDQIPHDLWAAADLPPLPLVDRITLVAGQFDLTFTLSSDGRRLTLVPIPDEIGVPRDYPAAAANGATAKHASGAATRFTGRVVNKPLGEVLRYIGTQFGFEMEIDHEGLARADVSMDQLVSFSVKDATADELLAAVLEPVGCTFRRRGQTIEINAAK